MFICTATCYELKSVASLFTVTKRNCQKTYVHLSENTSGNISKYVLENKQPINIFQTYAIQGKRQNCNICLLFCEKQNSCSVASFSSINWLQKLELVSVHRTKPLLILD